MGPGLMAGQAFQLIVPRGTWQGARLFAGGRFALLGATMAPGFEYDDFEEWCRSELVAAFPAFKTAIEELTN